MNVTRRRFIKSAALAAGAPAIIPASVLGRNGRVAPSNRIVVAGIGLGPRGRDVLGSFLRQPDVQFVGVADVQASRRETIRRLVMRKYGVADCFVTRDMFDVFDRKDVDAILTATGDPWHAPVSILAARAGKDIYCEKPCSMTIRESQELADAVHLHQRIFQAGTQRRNVDNFRFAVQLARSGKLGKIHTVHAAILPLRPDQKRLPAQPEPEPEVLDWDRWLGPAPWRPFNREYVRGRWRGHYDFHAGAGLLEWASHTVDLCQWAANADETIPVEFKPVGRTIEGRYAGGEKLVMRLAGFKGEGDWVVPGTCPVRFEGEEGWVETADLGKIAASSDALLADRPAGETAGTSAVKHVRDFLDCVKSRKKPAAHADVIRHGHITCHAAAIGWQLGRPVKFDPQTELFFDDEEANRMCFRARREPWHL